MEPTQPPVAKGRFPRLSTMLGVFGIGAAALTTAVWIFRIDIAEAALRGVLERRGVPGDLSLTRLTVGGGVLEDVRVGPAGAPAFTAERVEFAFSYRGLAPRLAGLSFNRPMLRLGITDKGLDLGPLAPMLEGAPARERQPLPRMALSIVDGRMELATPWGLIPATITARGRLDQDFTAEANIAPTTLKAEGAAVDQLKAVLSVKTEGPALKARLNGGVTRLQTGSALLESIAFSGEGALALSLASADAAITATAASAASGETLRLSAPKLAAQWASPDLRPGLRPGQTAWQVRLEAPEAGAAGALTAKGMVVTLSGRETGPAAWTIGAGAWEGYGLAAAGEIASGDVAFGEVISARGALKINGARLTPAGAAAFSRSWPDLAAAPIGPQAAALKARLLRAGQSFGIEAPLALSLRGGKGALDFAGPIEAESADGLGARFTADGARPALRVALPTGALEAAGAFSFAGPGAPPISLALSDFSLAEGKTAAAAALSIADWRAGAAAFSTQGLKIALTGTPVGTDIILSGKADFTGALGGAALERANLPIALAIRMAGQEIAVRPTAGAATLTANRLTTPALLLDQAAFQLRPGPSGAFFSRDAAGRLGGGLEIAGGEFNGSLSGQDPAPARLSFTGASARFSGAASAPELAFALAAPALEIAFSPARQMRLAAPKLEGAAKLGAAWQVSGAFAEATLEDPTLPVNLARLSGGWSLGPEGEAAVLRVSKARALVTDKEKQPRFEPLAVTGADAALRDGVVRAEGAIALAENGTRLARFTAVHRLEEGAGEAEVRARDVRFGPSLELFQLTELARGVVENVEGPVDADFDARWRGEEMRVTGTLSLKNLNAATAGLGPITGVTGKIAFDDALMLSTPPGQLITIAELNPGVAVRQGAVRFQLKPEGKVALEEIAFPLAGGRLSIDPAEITIGAEETRYVMRLSKIDVTALLEAMNIKDLSATGTVGGEFPLIVTPSGARIEKGVLRAEAGGGLIAYTGEAGADVEGAGKIAFDALRSFRYDNLEIEFSGELDKEIITTIRFNGRNEAPISAPGTGGGLLRAEATGLPFRYNVRVSAPFRALSQAAERFVDPLKLLRDQGPKAAPLEKVP